MKPQWLLRAVVLAIHEEQLAEHGGKDGLRDIGLLDAALERPKNHLAYADPSPPDIFALAAAYAHGIARNHPFLDGNKRTSFSASVLFLALNGFTLTAPQAEIVKVWLELAGGTIGEAFLADWFKANSSS